MRSSSLTYLGFLASLPNASLFLKNKGRNVRYRDLAQGQPLTGDADSVLAALVHRSAFLAGDAGIHRLAYRRLSAPHTAMCKITLLTTFTHSVQTYKCK